MIDHPGEGMRNAPVPRLIAIGSSTGGPRALQQVLTDLNAAGHVETPVLIVQHMPAGFTQLLAKRLDSFSEHHVKEAENGECIRKKTIYIAPADYHMEIVKYRTELKIELTQSPPKKGHRPSVDVMLESLSKLSVSLIAVILTGMGNDGTQGIKALKENDPFIQLIAESEETSVVFGMPKSAIATNLVDFILPLHRIGGKIKEIITGLGGN
ncbi:CheB methylesterase domain-containing protein [Virgibacillus halophilus]|uniref:CheB methylesterase domain-containing protein n=1 Tax=Tigheibacillus halophilus TaxID=361280 RepID=UPI0036F26D08